MAYAQVKNIEDRLGRDLDPDEARIVDARLDDAETLIETRIPDLHQRVEDGRLKERLVMMVEADVVLRLVKNPEGYTQETDGNYSYSIDSRVASGRLSLLDEEWLMLGISPSVVLISPTIYLGGYGPEGFCDPGSRVNPNADIESGIYYGCQVPPRPEPDPGTAVWG